MKITARINGVKTQLMAEDYTTIKDVIKDVDLNHIAVELNGNREKNLNYIIQDKDSIEWAFYMAGGREKDYIVCDICGAKGYFKDEDIDDILEQAKELELKLDEIPLACDNCLDKAGPKGEA